MNILNLHISICRMSKEPFNKYNKFFLDLTLKYDKYWIFRNLLQNTGASSFILLSATWLTKYIVSTSFRIIVVAFTIIKQLVEFGLCLWLFFSWPLSPNWPLLARAPLRAILRLRVDTDTTSAERKRSEASMLWLSKLQGSQIYARVPSK